MRLNAASIPLVGLITIFGAKSVFGAEDRSRLWQRYGVVSHWTATGPQLQGTISLTETDSPLFKTKALGSQYQGVYALGPYPSKVTPSFLAFDFGTADTEHHWSVGILAGGSAILVEQKPYIAGGINLGTKAGYDVPIYRDLLLSLDLMGSLSTGTRAGSFWASSLAIKLP